VYSTATSHDAAARGRDRIQRGWPITPSTSQSILARSAKNDRAVAPHRPGPIKALYVACARPSGQADSSILTGAELGSRSPIVTFPAFRKSGHAEPRSTESEIVRLPADSAAEAEKAAEAIATGRGQRNPSSLAIDDRVRRSVTLARPDGCRRSPRSAMNGRRTDRPTTGTIPACGALRGARAPWPGRRPATDPA
jgi:hypothetical protein